MNKREIVKNIYKHMLVDDTSATESVGAKMSEFGKKCGSSRRGCLSEQIKGVYTQWVTGTSSIYILWLFFFEGNKLWICSECQGLDPNINIFISGLSWCNRIRTCHNPLSSATCTRVEILCPVHSLTLLIPGFSVVSICPSLFPGLPCSAHHVMLYVQTRQAFFISQPAK